jgi:RHS repeat-associated protein
MSACLRMTAWGATLLLALALAAGCSSPQPVPAEEVRRLHPTGWRMDTNVVPVSYAALRDGDTSTAASLRTATRLVVEFDRPTLVSALKLLDAHNVRVEAGGRKLEVSTAGLSRWQTLELEPHSRTTSLEVWLTPLGPDAQVAEVELWGLGRPPAPRNPEALAAAPRAEDFENLVRVPGQPTTLSLDVTPDSRCAATSFPLGLYPAQVRRAFLHYRGEGLKRAVVLERSLNGHGASGGFWLGSTAAPRPALDELNPAQLESFNRVVFCLPREASAAVKLEDIALVVELEDGTNVLSHEGQAHAGEAWDLDRGTSRALSSLSASFSRPTEVEGVWLVVDGPSAQLQAAELETREARLPVQAGVALSSGLSVLALPEGERPTAQAVRLTFAGAARADLPAAHLAEVGIRGSPVGPVLPSIVVTYPQNAEHFGTTAFVTGFVTGNLAAHGGAQVSLNGEALPSGGTFSRRLTRAQAQGPWQVEVVARLGDGTVLSRTLVLDRDASEDLLRDEEGDAAASVKPDDILFGAVDEVAVGQVGPSGGKVSLGERVKLLVPEGAVDKATALSIQRRARTSVPRLDAALINVTAPGGAGYRFRPAGQKFKKPVRVQLPYDAALLPPAMTPDDIQTYYYDEGRKEWVALSRVAVRRGTQVIESETDHFTFMINAVLVLPDSPGPVSFNPTSLKDLEAADPSASVDVIEPPSGNSEGTARLAMPIRIPRARGTYQPDVRLVYDSAASNGWVGVGWNVSTSSVDVETRFGVPVYGPPESENVRYLLDGAPLVEGADEPCIDTRPGKRFYPRAESSFRRIRRCGASPYATSSTPYYWEVTATDGTVFIYGLNLQAAGGGPPNSRLAGYADGQPIARWLLERVVDTSGNLTEYRYFLDSEGADNGCPGGAKTCEPFRQVYLQGMTYTGAGAGPTSGGTPGRYHVDFLLQRRNGSEVERTDVLVSARVGFKTVTRYLLERVSVSFDSSVIREYVLGYQPGDFGKTLLAGLTVKNGEGRTFYSHAFDWYRNEAGTGGKAAFSAPVDFALSPADGKPLSEGLETSQGVSLYVGLSPTGQKSLSAGLRGAYESRAQAMESLLVDINGDGLPDRITLAEGSTQPLVSYNQGTPSFEDFKPKAPANHFSLAPPPGEVAMAGHVGPQPVGLTDIGRERGKSISAGLEAYLGLEGTGLGLGFSLGTTFGTSDARSALLDANGDGLVDHVSPSGVFFQRQRLPSCVQGDPLCRGAEALSFEPGQVLAQGVDEQLQSDESLRQAMESVKDEFHPVDPVLQWVAPYAGDIRIRATVRRRAKGGSDGVTLTAFHNGAPLKFRVDGSAAKDTLTLGGQDTTQHVLEAGPFSVGRTDRIYFKLTTHEDFPVQVPADGGTPESLDEVAFEPVITYAGRDLALKDVTGAPLFQFSQKEDFRVAGDPVSGLMLAQGGRVKLRVKLKKHTATSDGVRVCIQHFAGSEKLENRPCAMNPRAAETRSLLAVSASQVGEFEAEREVRIQAGEHLVVRQESDVPYDPGSAVLEAELTLTEVCSADGKCEQLAQDDMRALRLRPPVYSAVHRSSAAPAAPYVVPQDGEYVLRGSFWLGFAPLATHLVLVKDGRQLLKHSLPACPVGSTLDCDGDGKLAPLRLHLRRGDQLNFEMHSEVEFAGAWTTELLRVVEVDGGEKEERVASIEAPRTFDADALGKLVTTIFGEKKPLSGGYRGWRFGQWNGNKPFNEAEYDRLNEEAYKGLSNAEVVDTAVEAGLTPESDESTILRLFVPMLGTGEDVELRPGERLWAGPDRFAYVGAGVMHAGRKGGYAAGDASPGLHGGMLVAFRTGSRVRSAFTQSFNVGLSFAGLASASTAFGLSETKLELLDMNGDGLVDILRPDAVSLTSPTFGRMPWRPIEGVAVRPVNILDATSPSIPSGLRTSHDFAFSLGMGVGNLKLDISPGGRARAAATNNPPVGLGLSAGVGLGVSRQVTTHELLDINGDGLPDQVRREGGVLKVRLNLGNRFAQTEDTLAVSPWAKPLDGFGAYLQKVAPELGTQGEASGKAAEEKERRRSALQGWVENVHSANVLQHTSSMTLSENLGFGVDAVGGFGVSHALQTSLSKTPVALMDVTGDGLPDYVRKGADDAHFLVQVNLGHGFGPVREFAAQPWKVPSSQALSLPCFSPLQAALAAPYTEVTKAVLGQGDGQCSSEVLRGVDTLMASGVHSDATRLNNGVYVTFPIPLYPVVLINLGLDVATRRSGFELGMQDIDGDGFADHVLKAPGGGQVYARLNQQAGGNLLRAVTRPLRGHIRLEYARVGNTVAMPESRHVLHKVTVKDSERTPDAAVGQAFTTSYEYAGGRYDRGEREFFGFSTVRRKAPDGSVVAQQFRNERLSTRGLLVSEALWDAAGRTMVETVNEYDVRRLASATAECTRKLPHPLNASAAACEVHFSALTREVRKLYEGQGTPSLSTAKHYTYDCTHDGPECFGNVTSFHDEGSPGPADDVKADVTHTASVAALRARHVVGHPRTLKVVAADGALLRQREGEYDTLGRLARLTSSVGRGEPDAVSRLTWTPGGNLETVTGPANHKGQHYSVTYGYDREVETYPTSATDAYGLTSQARYDVRYGEALQVLDTAGNCNVRVLDGFGRLVALYGPEESRAAAGGAGSVCEAAAGATPTVRMEYVLPGFPHYPYAVTRHRLPPSAASLSSTANTLDTVTLMDGLQRVVQTKKHAAVVTAPGGAPQVGYTVSGHVRFDAMGRTASEGQPLFSQASAGTYVAPAAPGGRNPTHYTYDVLGRVLSTKLPDRRTTTMRYGFGVPAGDSVVRLRAEVEDAKGNVRVLFRDMEDRVVAVEERLDGRPLTTRYAYKPLGELQRIVDARGNTTRMEYDLLGRRTALANPDTGLVTYRFDAAGNLVKKVDAELARRKEAIAYEYDFTRLVRVDNPSSADVVYEYGPPGAAENASGRVVRVVDEAGEETRGYDRLGNMVRTTRTVRGLRPGARAASYTTRFDFDAFGRMQWVEYPDGERVTYGYDVGGLLASAVGRHGGARTLYLEALHYDEFGQRAYMKLGNGVTTTYAYRPLTRELESMVTTLPASAGGRKLQNLTYEYDAASNVKQVVNALGAATQRTPGEVVQTYEYDTLYRLTSAKGQAEVSPGVWDRYQSSFGYDEIHNLTSKVQAHVVREASGQEVRHASTNHTLAYAYEGPRPHAATQIGDTALTYDASGNTLTEVTSPPGGLPRQRRYVWSEAGWLKEAYVNGNATSFLYDASGERVVKRGKYGETTYVGQLYTVKNGVQGTKHVFAGATRLAAKLDTPPQHGPVEETVPGGPATLAGVRGCTMGIGGKTGLLPRCEEVLGGVETGGTVLPRRPETFWYHSNHLGSTSYLTDASGAVFESIEYFPYGEAWLEERRGRPISEFRFTGKPQDPETELTYFGARYYDARHARWESPDPLLFMQDALSPLQLSAYAYGSWNPILYVDPDGLNPRHSRERFEALSPRERATIDAQMAPLKQAAKHSAQWEHAYHGSSLVRQVLYDFMERVGGNNMARSATGETEFGERLSMQERLSVGASGLVSAASNASIVAGPITGLVRSGVSKRLAAKGTARGSDARGLKQPDNGTFFVDPKGNAIPTPPGGKITGSPDGRFIQARDAAGNPTGVRLDGPHNPKSHPDPRAQQPHGHVPGVTNPDGTPWLPVK